VLQKEGGSRENAMAVRCAEALKERREHARRSAAEASAGRITFSRLSAAGQAVERARPVQQAQEHVP
jgi:hypothetical protein